MSLLQLRAMIVVNGLAVMSFPWNYEFKWQGKSLSSPPRLPCCITTAIALIEVTFSYNILQITEKYCKKNVQNDNFSGNLTYMAEMMDAKNLKTPLAFRKYNETGLCYYKLKRKWLPKFRICKT